MNEKSYLKYSINELNVFTFYRLSQWNWLFMNCGGCSCATVCMGNVQYFRFYRSLKRRVHRCVFIVEF